MGKSTISMVIFNSYVKLPEGNMTLLTRGLLSYDPVNLMSFDSSLTIPVPHERWNITLLLCMYQNVPYI